MKSGWLLVSNGGLTQNITPPDFETRIAILRNKIEDLDYIFPNDTLEYLAGQFDSNVRDLEGALNDISLMAKVKKLKRNYDRCCS